MLNCVKAIPLIVSLVLVSFMPISTAGCAKTPPNLSPTGATAFKNHQAQKALDVIRDIAVDANATVPPVMTTADTRKVVTWHRSAITVIHEQGGMARVLATLDELLKDLPPAESQLLLPYVTLAKTILTEATK